MRNNYTSFNIEKQNIATRKLSGFLFSLDTKELFWKTKDFNLLLLLCASV